MAKLTLLTTTYEIIDRLGGDPIAAISNRKVAAMLGTTDKAVGNWRYSGFFPPDTYLAIRKALKRKKAEAPDELWSMRPLLGDKHGKR